MYQLFYIREKLFFSAVRKVFFRLVIFFARGQRASWAWDRGGIQPYVHGNSWVKIHRKWTRCERAGPPREKVVTFFLAKTRLKTCFQVCPKVRQNMDFRIFRPEKSRIFPTFGRPLEIDSRALLHPFGVHWSHVRPVSTPSCQKKIFLWVEMANFWRAGAKYDTSCRSSKITMFRAGSEPVLARAALRGAPYVPVGGRQSPRTLGN